MKAGNQYELVVWVIEKSVYDGYFLFGSLPTQDPFFTFGLLWSLRSLISAHIISQAPFLVASTNWRLTHLKTDQRAGGERPVRGFLSCSLPVQRCIPPWPQVLWGGSTQGSSFHWAVAKPFRPFVPSAMGVCGGWGRRGRGNCCALLLVSGV